MSIKSCPGTGILPGFIKERRMSRRNPEIIALYLKNSLRMYFTRSREKKRKLPDSGVHFHPASAPAYYLYPGIFAV
jgi:hypothetical protein